MGCLPGQVGGHPVGQWISYIDPGAIGPPDHLLKMLITAGEAWQSACSGTSSSIVILPGFLIPQLGSLCLGSAGSLWQ